MPRFSCVELNGEMCEPHELLGIQASLRSPMLNNYGAREMWPIGLTCAWGTMHVCDKLVYVEAPDKEVLITSIVKRRQPLIKYSIGDLADVSWAECNCGKRGIVITRLVGRKNDFLFREKGVKEHWALLCNAINSCILDNPNLVREYGVHQKKNYDIEISIVKGEYFDPRICQILSDRAGEVYPKLKFTVIVREAIETHRSGKKIYFKCDVDESVLPIPQSEIISAV